MLGVSKKEKIEKDQTEPYRLQVSQKAVIYNPEEDKFLLVKDVDETNFFSTHYGPWELVGGRLSAGEKLAEGFLREVEEETGGVDYQLVDILGAFDFEYKAGKAVMIGYLVIYRGGEIKLSSEHSDYRWETAKEILENGKYKSWLKEITQLAIKRLEREKYLEGWKRCQADFENYKKRQAELQKEIREFANQNLILEVLPIIDNFYASTNFIPEEQKDNPWVTGIMHIQRQLEAVLENNGVSEIVVSIGADFDPAIHEAIENKECQKGECKNKIKKVAQKGYKIGEKVIRPARVIVE